MVPAPYDSHSEYLWYETVCLVSEPCGECEHPDPAYAEGDAIPPRRESPPRSIEEVSDGDLHDDD